MRKKGSRNSEMDKKTDRKGGRNLYSPVFKPADARWPVTSKFRYASRINPVFPCRFTPGKQKQDCARSSGMGANWFLTDRVRNFTDAEPRGASFSRFLPQQCGK